MAQNISVPDIGDFKDVEVIEVLVKPGDQINKNDPIVTIESDKSSVEIPSPAAGEIKDLKVKIGDKVSEGSVLATIENGKVASTPKEEEIEKKLAETDNTKTREEIEKDAELLINLTTNYKTQFVLGTPPNYEPKKEDSIAEISQKKGISELEVMFDEMMKNNGTNLIYACLL